MRLMLLTAALLAAEADLGAVQASAPEAVPQEAEPIPTADKVDETGATGEPPAEVGSGENTAQGQRILALESRITALEAALAAKGHETLTSSPPMPRPGMIVMVKEPHHPDYPAIVAEVVDDLGAIHANVFRGTHVPHAVNHLPNIEPGAEGPGWYWQGR